MNGLMKSENEVRGMVEKVLLEIKKNESLINDKNTGLSKMSQLHKRNLELQSILKMFDWLLERN